ncbi:MAG: aspartate dehydrogenase [Hyphomicrobiaceae bacterium]|nr:aspartate dehydrogenase [Hyphomicrobiaceae bacterium]
MNQTSNTPLRLAIAGLGAIGLTVARRVDEGGIEDMVLTAVSARDKERANQRISDFAKPPAIVALGELATAADVVVESVPAAHFLDVARPALEAGRIFMPLSVGVLLNHMELVDLAREKGGQIIVPTGALIGLDAVRAARSGGLRTVKLVTRKPPAGLKGAPYVEENGIDLENLSEPKKLFSGSAREAAKGFPANLNVGAALALAGLGPDETKVEIWADPGLSRNIQSVSCTSDSADFSMSIENIPSGINPRTGRITAHSVIAALERLTSPLVVGT